VNSNTQQGMLAVLLKRVERVERVVTFTCFLVLITAVFADVVSRQLSGAGLHWARQVGVYANVVVILFGIGLASAAGAHLRPRFADHWLPASWSGVLERMQDGVMALFCCIFAIVATGVVYEGFVLGERSAVLGIVIWPVQFVLPLVFAVATFRHGVYAWHPALRPVVTDSDAPQVGSG